MFMSPQHLQQLDRYHEGFVNARIGSLLPYDWGVIAVELDERALVAGQVRVHRFEGVLPDGLPLAFDAAHSEVPAIRPIEGHFPAAQRVLEIFLAVPAEREGLPAIAPANTPTPGLRFFTSARAVVDAAGGATDVNVAFAQRHVTVLFGDLRGFTTLSESSLPETVVEHLNRFYSLMSEAIFRNGGTLDKYLGDGVLALFGAPYGTERDAVKAVRAAIDMQRSMLGFNQELAAAGQPPIAMGIGINTGPAIVGFIGSGDTVNTASRLEHLAKPGQILISEHTMQALDASVSYRPLEAVQVKGRVAKLQIAEVAWAPK
jgi:class 3 adenylate cyclase